MVKYWVPVFCLAVLIGVGSSRPPNDLRLPFFPHADKMFHALVFGLLSFAVFRALYRGHGWSLMRAVIVSILLTSGYGALDEFHQSFTPGRIPDRWDWMADTVGACLAQMVHYFWSKRRLCGRRITLP